MDAVLNINKPPGSTSFQVTAKIRRLLAEEKAGHAGTLDPAASGVLLVLTGQATRIAQYLSALPKQYLATIKLGVETDSYDLDGRVLAENAVPDVSNSEILDILKSFTGQIDQVPPMFSALKKDGQPLYKLARQGIELDLQPRRVTIDRIDLVELRPPLVTVKVGCSKGTYIRSLAHDIGAKIGCGAALAALVRTAVGGFTIEDAIDIDAADPHTIQSRAMGMNAALDFLPQVAIDRGMLEKVRHGNPIPLPAAHGAQGTVRIIYGDEILGLAEIRQGGILQPVTMFVAR